VFEKVSIRFERFGTTSGLQDFAFYQVSVNYDGLGGVHVFSALLCILMFLGLKIMEA
jgi:hypothetical protein